MKYVVAVSGGIDSVALLHMLHAHTSHDLVVAHVDHGIRPDSGDDAQFVQRLAESYGLPVEIIRLELGSKASEEVARTARYAWLESVLDKHAADGIATAHHADDMLETAALNTVRGTGWRGIASLRSSTRRYRPLLAISKAQIVRYVLDHGLDWREDSTNLTLQYTRNRLRHGPLLKLTGAKRRELLERIWRQHELRSDIEAEARRILQQYKTDAGYSRYVFVMVPDDVALELLRQATHGRLDPKQTRKLLHFVRTGKNGAVLEAGGGYTATMTGGCLQLNYDKIEQLIR